jgi:uncharacterized membrane protein YphA (DoxX/SURF4 family)
MLSGPRSWIPSLSAYGADAIDHRVLGYAVLRATVGAVFLLWGVGKLQAGPFVFAQGLQDDFARTWLPPFLVYHFGLALPFLEVAVGSLLILGLVTLFALAGAGLLVLALTAGLVVAGNAGGVAHNLAYTIALYLLLRHHEENGYSLDARRHTGSSQSPMSSSPIVSPESSL